MRWSILFFPFVALSLLALPAHAEVKNPQAKIALCNTRDVLTKCDAGAKAIDEIKAMFADRQEKLNALRQEVVALQNSAKSTGLEKNLKKNDLEAKARKYAQDEAELRRDVAVQEEAKLKPIAEKIGAVLKAYGQEKGLTGIQELSLYLYSDPSLDVTDEILRRVNQAQ